MTTEQERREEADEAQGDRVPSSDERQEELVDEAIDESFPASDPPSYPARETTGEQDG